MLLDGLHQEADGENRNGKGHDHANGQDAQFAAGKAMELEQFDQRAAEYRRNGQKECELCGGAAASAFARCRRVFSIACRDG